jgi:hypothetical protein
MISSSVAITAARIFPARDYADLDGNLHVDNDPYSGRDCRGGR